MKNLIIIFLFCIYIFSELAAQSYTTSAGIRIGNSIGLSVNQRILKKVSVEGILQNDFNQTTYLHLLARKHNSLITRRANFYYGGGVHFGVQNGAGGVAGFDGILGIEMTLLRLNISGDLKPQLTSGEGNGLSLNGGVSVRYVLVQGNAFDKWERKRKKNRRKRDRQKNKGSVKDKINDILH